MMRRSDGQGSSAFAAGVQGEGAGAGVSEECEDVQGKRRLLQWGP